MGLLLGRRLHLGARDGRLVRGRNCRRGVEGERRRGRRELRMARWRGDHAGCFVGVSALGRAAGARRGRGAVVIDSDDRVTMALEGLILRDWDVFAGLQRRLFEFLLWNDRLAQEEQATSAVLQAVVSRQVRSASRLRILMPYALLLKHLIQFLDALLLLLHLVERLRRQPPEFANHLLELGVRRLAACK